MKKYILITALILSSLPLNAAELFESPEDLENFHKGFYEAPIAPIPTVEVIEANATKEIKGMPLFKKTRIKVTNYLRTRDHKKQLELIEKQKQEFEAANNAENEVKVNNKINKEDEKIDETAEKTLELEGAVKEQVTSNDAVLDADKVDYDEKSMDMTATGNPVLVFPPQEVTLKADKMIYNRASNILRAYGNVEIIKNGTSTFGDYIQVNMNEENALIDNLKTQHAFVTVRARTSEAEGNKIILKDGKLASEDHYVLKMHTRMIGGNRFDNMLIDDDDKSSITDEIGKTSINVKAEKVLINAKKDNNTISLKNAIIKYGDVSLFKIPSVTIHTNKKNEFFEGNYPELGSKGRLGMFAGPGFVFDTPLQNGSTLKLMPIINNKSGIGFGGFAKYRSATNYTELGYGSSADVFILKGRQYLDDKLYMQYGVNSYMDEWWFGPRMSKYNAELIYKDRTTVANTLADGLDLRFSQRAGIGYMQDSDFNRHGENIQGGNIGTMRFKYMSEAAQTLYKYRNLNADLKAADLQLVLQGSAAVYGTGDTQFIGRVGPRIHTQYKYWMQDVGGFISAIHDKTPMPIYDTYRYGNANIYLRESLRLHKYLTVAWSGSLTLTGDSPNGKMFQENSFIVALGPDDFKLNIGYDWVREQTYFAFCIAMDTKGSSLEYEKMEIKNPDRLSKENDEKVKLVVFDTDEKPSSQPSSVKMQYAEVIDIEDPDREQI